MGKRTIFDELEIAARKAAGSPNGIPLNRVLQLINLGRDQKEHGDRMREALGKVERVLAPANRAWIQGITAPYDEFSIRELGE